MSTGFFATEFSITEERGVLVTALGTPSTEEDDFYLMLQHADHHTKQDVRLGMNQPYIEYCGQGWSRYGHIEHFELLRDRVKVQMNSAAASHMGNDGLIEIEFALSDFDFACLRAALERTFHHQAYFIERV